MTTTKSFKSRHFAMLFAGTMFSALTGAQAYATDLSTQNNERAGGNYWTEERMRSAKPLPMPEVTSQSDAREAAPRGRSQIGPAFKPDRDPRDQSKAADTAPDASPDAGEADGRSKGTSNLPFTTSRVFPDSTVNAWPYRMAGKLFFRDPRTGGNFTCSASIHSQRLIITAGHCVYNASGRYFYSNFQFVPAYNAFLSTQPFGTWGWSWAITTSQWAGGGGSVPNVSDFGLIEAADLSIAGAVRQIGNYLGWYGWQTYALTGNHVTQLGYPSNLDSAWRMIQSNAQVVANGSTSITGSAMWKGVSGGPWVQDFGVQSSGQSVTSTGPNRIVGISSYVPSAGNTPTQYLGSSVLNNDFVRIRNTACAHRSGNC